MDSKFKVEIAHDSMGFSKKIKELRGVKLGQVVDDRTITHITGAGEAIFDDGSWNYVDAINGTHPEL